MFSFQTSYVIGLKDTMEIKGHVRVIEAQISSALPTRSMNATISGIGIEDTTLWSAAMPTELEFYSVSLSRSCSCTVI